MYSYNLNVNLIEFIHLNALKSSLPADLPRQYFHIGALFFNHLGLRTLFDPVFLFLIGSFYLFFARHHLQALLMTVGWQAPSRFLFSFLTITVILIIRPRRETSYLSAFCPFPCLQGSVQSLLLEMCNYSVVPLSSRKNVSFSKTLTIYCLQTFICYVDLLRFLGKNSKGSLMCMSRSIKIIILNYPRGSIQLSRK